MQTSRKSSLMRSALTAAMFAAAGLTVAAPAVWPEAARAAASTGGYVELVRDVSPAVVYVEVEKSADAMRFDERQMPGDFPFQRFFGQQPDERGAPAPFPASLDYTGLIGATSSYRAPPRATTLP